MTNVSEELQEVEKLEEDEELKWKKMGGVIGTEKELKANYPQWRETGFGNITFLRVCFDDSWGWHTSDRLYTEVVVEHSASNRAFGFYLRPSKAGENLSANLAMLSTIRDSIVHNISVSIGYWVRLVYYHLDRPPRESYNCLMQRVNIKP